MENVQPLNTVGGEDLLQMHLKCLIEQIDDFLRQYPDTVLVAVDTFQHIRDTL